MARLELATSAGGVDWRRMEERLARLQFRTSSGARRRLWAKLAKLIANGVQLLAALETLRERRLASGGRSHPQTLALTAWIASMRNGEPLARAIRDWVGREEAMLIAAGEASGTLERALRSCVEVMAARKRIMGAVRAGIAYPAFLTALGVGLLALYGFKVVPAFQSAVPAQANAAWHGLAAALIAVSGFVRSWLWAVIAALLALVVAFFASLPRFDGPVRVALDRYPPYSVYRVMQGSTWLIALSALVEAGLRIENALESLAATAAPWLRRRVRACLAGMRSGKNLGEALAASGTGFPDREIIDDMSVYAALSGFDVAINVLGREWLEESVERIAAGMRVALSVSLVFLGAVFSFAMGGMFAMQIQLQQILRQVMH